MPRELEDPIRSSRKLELTYKNELSEDKKL